MIIILSHFAILSDIFSIVKTKLHYKDLILRNLNQIIDGLKKFFDLKNETEVAKFLGVEQNTLSSWKKRDKIPYEKLDEIATKYNLSMDWLLGDNKTKNSEFDDLLYYFESLPHSKQEIYFLRIKADALEEASISR